MKKIKIINIMCILILSISLLNGCNSLLEKYDGQTDYNGVWEISTIAGVGAEEYQIVVLDGSTGNSESSPMTCTWIIEGNDIKIDSYILMEHMSDNKINYLENGFDILSTDNKEIYETVEAKEVDGEICLVYKAINPAKATSSAEYIMRKTE